MKNKKSLFFQFIREFLTKYLPLQKAASPNTVKAYKDTLNLFLDYLNEQQGIALRNIDFPVITKTTVESFLEWLETDKNYSVSSRNQRLSGLKSFCRYAAGRDKTLAGHYQELSEIPKKKQTKGHEIEFFNENALQSILAEPDISMKKGQRDMVFMMLLYDTAARIQEILDIRMQDISLTGDNPYIVLHGKGKKTRLVPLMDKTALHLEKYIHCFHKEQNSRELLFFISKKSGKTAMSPDNAAKFIKKYGCQARDKNPEVPAHLYPHMFRHSRAMHLYRNGMPLPLLSEWLGHSQMETTIMYYANADTAMKKEAIEKATSEFNPLFLDNPNIDWENDDEMIKRLYGLI